MTSYMTSGLYKIQKQNRKWFNIFLWKREHLTMVQIGAELGFRDIKLIEKSHDQFGSVWHVKQVKLNAVSEGKYKILTESGKKIIIYLSKTQAHNLFNLYSKLGLKGVEIIR